MKKYKQLITIIALLAMLPAPMLAQDALAPSEIQYADSTDYLLGGALTLKNGRIDKYQFGGGLLPDGEAQRHAGQLHLPLLLPRPPGHKYWRRLSNNNESIYIGGSPRTCSARHGSVSPQGNADGRAGGRAASCQSPR